MFDLEFFHSPERKHGARRSDEGDVEDGQSDEQSREGSSKLNFFIPQHENRDDVSQKSD